jgi:hypothetical protein
LTARGEKKRLTFLLCDENLEESVLGLEFDGESEEEETGGDFGGGVGEEDTKAVRSMPIALSAIFVGGCTRSRSARAGGARLRTCGHKHT